MTDVTGPRPIFDRTLRLQRLERAAPRFADHDFLHREIIVDIVDRLETVQRHFANALVIGPGSHLLKPALTPACDVGTLFTADLHARALPIENGIVIDEEALPIADNILDLIVSIMGLHHVNDIPGALIQMRRALKPDGLLIAALPAENTLENVKQALYKAESELTGGVSPRISPFAAIKDLGGLLQRAGFALPVADCVPVPVTYRNPMTLFQDLRGMGETNILHDRKRSSLRRDVLMRTIDLLSAAPTRSEGAIDVNFEIVVLTGWAPHESQQKPLKPGSAKVPLEQVFKAK